MRITEVSTFVLKVPLPRGIKDATPHLETVEYWGVPGVRIHTDSGLVGTGFTGTQGGEELVQATIRDYYAPILLGSDPLNINELWDRLHWSCLNWIGRAGITAMAHSAVDIALWDIAAKQAGLPLCKYLGLHKPEGVPVYNTNAGWLNWSDDELVADMSSLLEAGWSALKMKVGNSDPKTDIKRVRLVRRELGHDFKLMVDANQAWRIPQALEFSSGVADCDITWLEEPLHPDDVQGHQRLASKISIPIALGEVLYSKYQFRDFITHNAVSYAQPDVTRVSGVTEWLRIAGLCASNEIPIIPHHGDFGQVQQHLVAATPAAVMMEYIPWLTHIFENPVYSENGRPLQIPDAPGASTDIKQSAFEEYQTS